MRYNATIYGIFCIKHDKLVYLFFILYVDANFIANKWVQPGHLANAKANPRNEEPELEQGTRRWSTLKHPLIPRQWHTQIEPLKVLRCARLWHVYVLCWYLQNFHCHNLEPGLITTLFNKISFLLVNGSLFLLSFEYLKTSLKYNYSSWILQKRKTWYS